MERVGFLTHAETIKYFLGAMSEEDALATAGRNRREYPFRDYLCGVGIAHDKRFHGVGANLLTYAVP